MDPVRTLYEEFGGDRLAVDLPQVNLVVRRLEELKVALTAPRDTDAAANVTGEIAARMTSKRRTAREAGHDLIQGVPGGDVRPYRP